MDEAKKALLERYKEKKCDVCGKVDEDLDFVIYGIRVGDSKVKICYNCDSFNWISTYRR